MVLSDVSGLHFVPSCGWSRAWVNHASPLTLFPSWLHRPGGFMSMPTYLSMYLYPSGPVSLYDTWLTSAVSPLHGQWGSRALPSCKSTSIAHTPRTHPLHTLHCSRHSTCCLNVSLSRQRSCLPFLWRKVRAPSLADRRLYS